jgi:hypothetical protein
MGFVEVVYIADSAQKTPPIGYDSWLTYWELHKEKPARSCEVMRCTKLPEVGGHVMRVGKAEAIYILPMCEGCCSDLGGEVFKAWESDLVVVK